MKVVILAAGSGARLRPLTDDTPVALLPVAGVPILRRTIAGLLRLGFEDFVIATGHLEPMVRDAVARWFPHLDVTFVGNPDFATTHNACSLSLLAPHVQNDAFLLLDGDVVFDLDVVEALLLRGLDSLAIRSVGDIGLEEIKVTADREDRVLTIGKHVPARGAMGESVGIQLLSATTSRRLFAALDARVRVQGLVHEYYEAAFQQIIDEGVALYGVDVGSMYATEIDTVDDLCAADARLAVRPAGDALPAMRLAV